MENSVRVVVARYDEDVSWLTRTGLECVVYDKGPDPVPRAVPLPNIGREAHTYLTHIVGEWDNLAEYTAFVQGDPFDHLDPDRAKGPEDLADMITRCARRGVPFRGLAWFKLRCDGQGRPHHLRDPENRGRWAGWGKDIPVDRVFRELFDAEPPGEYIVRAPAGLFCVAGKRIRTRPKAMFEHALRLVEDDPHDVRNTGHAFERLWQLIFNGNTLWNKDKY